LVARYKGGVHHWEVWNEPDNSLFWKPRPNAREYAELLKSAYKAVKDADPSAKVLSGGVSGNAVPFLEEMLAAGAGQSFDILALHPYAVPPDPAQGKVQSRPEVHKMVDIELAKYRAFLMRHSYDRPIWVTELGWPSGYWQLDAQSQADYLAQAYAQMLASGLAERIFWYSFKDESANPTDSWGLIGWGKGNTDLGPKRPAFSAYATSARMLAGTKPAGRLQLGPYQIIDDFEQNSAWTRSFNPNGAFTITPDQHHGSSSSGKLDYNFTGPNQAVDFAPPQPLLLPGKPTRLGLWIKGDSSGDYLSAWLRDRDGELFKVRLGAVMSATDGWGYYESRVNNYYFDWERTGGSPSNGAVDYPVQFVSFRLENTPDEPAGAGTIYVDDLQSFDGPDASAVRFTRDDGQVVDVLWSVDPTQVNLPTASSAQVIDRDGGTRAVNGASGLLPLNVSSSPIYVVHKPTGQASSTAQNLELKDKTANVGTQSICLATAPATPLKDSDSVFFPQTGHNLKGAFRQYWEQHGATLVLGYPITEEFVGQFSDGKSYLHQYFERARMEYHPEAPDGMRVQMGLLGVPAAKARNFPRIAVVAGDASISFFPETGHSIRLFRDWWTQQGGIPVFGFPLSEEIQEKNAADGKVYTVQYFERNRLEYHPEAASADNQVMLGLLGVEYLAQQGCHR
jgi:hypothetical protein